MATVGDSGRNRRGELRLVDPNAGAAARVTGEDVLRDGARMMARYFTRRLQELQEEDPLRPEIERLAAPDLACRRARPIC